EAAMLRGADGLVAVSPYVRDHALARRRAPVHVVPPGVDATLFCPDNDGAGDAGAGTDILFVGPLDGSYRWKGLDVLLAAFGQVQAPHARRRLGRRGRERVLRQHDWGRLALATEAILSEAVQRRRAGASAG